jgi:hypothetical protein
MDLFPSSGEVRDTHTLLGHLERANLSHWTGPNTAGVSLPSPEGGNRPSFQTLLCSSGGWTKLRDPAILSIVHHPQNPLVSTRCLLLNS